MTNFDTESTPLGTHYAWTNDSHIAHMVAKNGAFDPSSVFHNDGLARTGEERIAGQNMLTSWKDDDRSGKIGASFRGFWFLHVSSVRTSDEELQVVVDVAIDLDAEVTWFGERETERGVVDHSRQNAQ